MSLHIVQLAGLNTQMSCLWINGNTIDIDISRRCRMFGQNALKYFVYHDLQWENFHSRSSFTTTKFSFSSTKKNNSLPSHVQDPQWPLFHFLSDNLEIHSDVIKLISEFWIVVIELLYLLLHRKYFILFLLVVIVKRMSPSNSYPLTSTISS